MSTRKPSRLPTFEEANCYMHYPYFKRHVHTLLGDTTISDNELEVRARKHLQVLDDPRVAPYDRPSWPRPAYTEVFSTKRIFEAMYTTADDLGLERGRRYVSACICACAWPSGLLDSTGSTDIYELVKQASMLCGLAFDIWLVRMWRSLPRTRLYPAGPQIATPSSVSEQTRKQVVGRDEYTCFKTGTVDESAPAPIIAGPSTQTARLEIAPICDPTLSENPLLREWTIDFYKHYLGVDVTSLEADSPRNCLLLDRLAKKAFCGHYWTLRPTETPNQYTMVDTTVAQVFGTNARDGDLITFSESESPPALAAPSAAAASGLGYYTKAMYDGIWSFIRSDAPPQGPASDSDIEDPTGNLPYREALLIHAACTSFLHHAGILYSPAEFCMPPGFIQ